MNAEELAITGGRRPGPRIRKRVKARYLSLSFVLSFMCLVCGICLATQGSSTDCVTFLQWGLIGIGLVLMATFIVVANCLSCFKEGAICLHLVVMLVAIIALVVLMIQAFVHINIKAVDEDKPEHQAQQRIREYSLGDYRGRLRRRVAADAQYWARISGCLRHGHACDGMSPLHHDPDTGVLLDPGLSPIESGCCKPPLSCGFTYVNHTMWTVPAAAGVPTNSNTDCSRWSNDQEKLCFQCDSCKAGFLADIQKAWSSTVITVTIFTILHIIMYPSAVAELCDDE